MERKKKLLVIGIIMNCAGTEKSFLSFAQNLDYDKWDVDLMLARRTGALIGDIPEQVNIIDMPDPELADMFLLTGKNAAATIWKCFGSRNPLIMLEVLPYFLKIIFMPKKRANTATRLWCALLRHFTSVEKEYDVAAAYWGDRTMFYMIDKVRAKKKIAWLHFDYGNPPRDDELYLSYFKRCDNIVTVSEKVNDSLERHFPEIADKCVTIENINDPRRIWNLALQGESYPDPRYVGRRILTIGRISEQKGFDMVVDALVKLRDDELELRWYIIGGGDKNDVDALKAAAVEKGVADMLILLGVKMNPYPYMRDCDIYVQPSRYEGKPITVEEAKMMYKPIVATDYVSASEQLEGGELGLIVNIDADDIYRGVRRLLDDRALADNFSEKLAARNFGNRDEINKFYKLVEG